MLSGMFMRASHMNKLPMIRTLFLTFILLGLPVSSLAFTCREGLEHVVDGVHGPVPVAEHWELASDVLFGRPVQAWVQNRTLPIGDDYFVKFEIFESLKGDHKGEVVIRLAPEVSLFLIVGANYVVTLFDGGKLDLCSMIFEMPNFVDTMDELKVHADRTDYSRSNETLRELLILAAE
jgi:hypothetical protein